MISVLRVVHLLSATIWVGGTIVLVFVGVPAIRMLEGEARATALRALGKRWRPLGWSAMGVAVLSGLWLTDLHGGFDSGALGPRLQRETREGDPQAPATRRRLVMVGWFNFSLTIAVPILGSIVLTYLT